jgi:hypothetical protein
MAWHTTCTRVTLTSWAPCCGPIITLQLHAGFPDLFRVWALSITQGSILHAICQIKTNSFSFQCWSFTSRVFFWLHKFKVQGSILTPLVLLILARAKSHPQWYQLPCRGQNHMDIGTNYHNDSTQIKNIFNLVPLLYIVKEECPRIDSN